MKPIGNAIRFGVHSGQQYSHFDDALCLWRRAEELGYDWVSLFDHFRPPDRPLGPCFEGTALLSALAARTSKVRCGLLVSGVPYRHPAVLANIASTIDHVSGGRLELGLGAGALDLAHEEYGLPFPGIGERMDMLDETCRILRHLWTEESSSFKGKHFVLNRARLEPKPLQSRLPLVIGGSGERRLLRIVAEHADVWNTMATEIALYRHKLDVLLAHCADVGRDPANLRKSILFRPLLAETEAEAEKKLEDLVGPAAVRPEQRQAWLVIGTPKQCAERLLPYVSLGVDDFLLGLRSPIDYQTMELFAKEVIPLLR